MISAHTVEQVRAAEEELMAGLPDGALMQRAAHGLAAAVGDFLGGVYGRHVVLLVGAGNNGGDALYAGALLARRGARVEAWPVADGVHEQGLAALRAAGGHVRRPDDRRPGGAAFDVAVDGIVGIGGRAGLRPPAVAALDALPGVPVVAVDLPSGVDADTGEVDGRHVVADVTVTFGTHKPALLVDPAAGAAGAIHLVDIGLDLPPAPVSALQAADVAHLLPAPDPTAQKYLRGVVGVRAGSATYPGAALLSVAGASCGLAGMVRYVGAAADAVRTAHPEVVGAGRVQAWVVGSGGGDEAEAALDAALADDVPLVVDADALPFADRVAGRDTAEAVLTPHAGELARLLDVSRDDVESRPLHHARAAARRFEAVVVLKGRRTLVTRPDGVTRVTTSGTPWLATAGSGDVLGGVIGALLAAGLPAFDAASAGTWLHGAAGTLAARSGPIVAGDVARAIPAAVAGVAMEGSMP